MRIFTIERVIDVNSKEKTTNLVLEGIARLNAEGRIVDNYVWGGRAAHIVGWRHSE